MFDKKAWMNEYNRAHYSSQQLWRKSHPEKIAKYKYKRKHPDLHREAVQRWKLNNPDKVKAETEAYYHVHILDEKCAVCGTRENIERHHPDYSKPLEVVFLCAKHHKNLVKK